MSWIIKPMASVAFCLAALALAQADEKKIPLDQVPKTIMDTLKGRFDGAALKGAELVTEGGKTTYEITFKHNGTNYEGIFTPEGKLAEYEKEIPAKDVPKAVTDALEGKYSQPKYKLVEEVYKVTDGQDKLESYEIVFETSDNRKFEVLVSPEGKITKEEERKQKKD
jgi:hypothetical protein